MLDGNLVLDAELEVAAPGRYQVAGTLADLAGRPFGYAQAAQVLTPGRHWVALRYYGLIFHERAATGPYLLAAATVTSALDMPNARGPVVRNAHITGTYLLTEFTARPFGQPELLQAAERLERSARSLPLP